MQALLVSAAAIASKRVVRIELGGIKQLRENYQSLKGRVRGIDRALRLVREGAYFFVDVFVLPLSWIIKAWLWAIHKWKDIPLPDETELPTGVLTLLPLDATRAKGQIVTEVDLADIVEYGLEAFGEHDIDASTRRRMVQHFFRACPRAFRLLTAERPDRSGICLDLGSKGEGAVSTQKVGYTCVLPLKKQAYAAYRRGELRDYDFSEVHIISPRYPLKPRFLCIQAFALIARVNKACARSLLEGIAYHVSLYVSEVLAHRPVLIAEAATRSGRRLLERFAFPLIGESANRVPLYELDVRDYERLPQRARDTVLLLDTMVRRFAAARNRGPF